MSSPTARRRQRSTRLTVAVSLLTCAAVLVTVAFLGDVAWFQAFAAVSSVVLGAAATRITHSELMQSRRDAARDRAEQAQAYRELTEQRTDRAPLVLPRHAGTVGPAGARPQRARVAPWARPSSRAAEATRKFNAEARRAELAEQEGRAAGTRLEEAEEHAAETALRVSELEQELDVAARRARRVGGHAAPDACLTTSRPRRRPADQSAGRRPSCGRMTRRDPRGQPVPQRSRRHPRGFRTPDGRVAGGDPRPVRPVHHRPAHHAAARARAGRPWLGGSLGRRRPRRGLRARAPDARERRGPRPRRRDPRLGQRPRPRRGPDAVRPRGRARPARRPGRRLRGAAVLVGRGAGAGRRCRPRARRPADRHRRLRRGPPPARLAGAGGLRAGPDAGSR